MITNLFFVGYLHLFLFKLINFLDFKIIFIVGFSMCILDILNEFFPNFRAFNHWRYIEIKSKIFLIDFWKIRIGYFLIDKWVVDLYLLKRRKDLKFFFDFLGCIKDKSLHVHVTKIMRNALIKETTQFINKFFLFKGLFGFVIDNW